jgi:hypothetical protein
VPAEVPWQSQPPLAAALVQARHQAGGLPFTYSVAACLYGNRPDVWAACEACVGTVACVATPAHTPCWLQPLAPMTQTYTSKGAPRPTRGAVTETPPSTVAEVAHALPPTFWYRRTVSEGTTGPITYECARQRLMLCTEGHPTTARWLLSKRTLGAHPRSGYSLSKAPVRVPLRLFVWRSGVRWAMEQCFEDTKTALGLGHYEVRPYTGWQHPLRTSMRAHFFLWHLQSRLEKKSPSAYGLAGPEVLGGGVAPQSRPGG